ncbi:transglutaminase family protein [Massilia sp. IC2-476]|uniref:transglutaminase-like domain-containing protein n=1 Tax=Massilia sp. IC2-476 TaxID=2887199 RepID=UPI001D129031|nr:transglutaminase-like domain-containing protein [Massilia sp. IC2-476]MCC2970595.1 transglutaminase-like domain-containing protein [Massilia sp. IC2-476]
MKKLFVLLFLAAQPFLVFAQSNRTNLTEKIDTANLNLRALGEQITRNDGTDYQKAASLLNWVSNRLEWLATDYQRRTVKEILERGGGNCYELAEVYLALVREMNIKSRPIAEINLSRLNPERQAAAEQLVKEKGHRASVFGARHNDHRWLEVYDETSGKWLPVDPTMNVIGVEQWVKARLGFGKRVTIDPVISDDMIAPFAVFVTDASKANMIENRSTYYMVDQFNKVYHGELSKLPSWSKWLGLIRQLSEHSRLAFEKKENLHRYTKQIEELDSVYRDLKDEYLKSHQELARG